VQTKQTKEFVYDNNSGVNDKVSRNCLFACHSIFHVISIFVSTFLIAHIYSFSGNIYDYIFKVCIFNVSTYVTMFLTYFVIARIVDKTNRINVYRLSLIIQTALVVIFIFYGKEISKILILAGFMKGLGDSLYYASYNVLKQEMVSKKSMGNYVSGIYISTKLVDLICPTILGAIIDVTTYSFAAIIVGVVCLIQIIVSIFIKAKKPQNSKLSLKEFFIHVKENQKVNKQIKFIYFVSFLYVAALVNRIINICIMMKFESSLSLGIITSILGLVSVLTIFIVKKYTKAGHRNWLFIACGVSLVVASVLFAVDINRVTVIVYDAAIAIGGVTFKINYDAYRNGILKEAGMYDDIAEHHVVMESIYNIVRIVGFSAMLLIALTKQLILFKIYLIIISIMYAIAFISIGIYEKKYIVKKDE